VKFYVIYFMQIYLYYVSEAVAHAYIPNNSGGRDQEDHCSSPAQAKMLAKPHLNKLGMVEYSVIQATWEAIGRRITV
jgi:hypothetical protein